MQALLTTAPGNGAAIGGPKVIDTAHGWFAARPSGTEDVYKLYAESFRGEPRTCGGFSEEAQAIIAKTLRSHAMTSDTAKNGAPPSELSSIVRATDEEKQVLLHRAFLIRHGETAWSLTGSTPGLPTSR